MYYLIGQCPPAVMVLLLWLVLRVELLYKASKENEKKIKLVDDGLQILDDKLIKLQAR